MTSVVCNSQPLVPRCELLPLTDAWLLMTPQTFLHRHERYVNDSLESVMASLNLLRSHPLHAVYYTADLLNKIMDLLHMLAC